MKISVAICTYNGAQFIEQQLLSIYQQTISPDEIILCDDESTDNTLDIVEAIAKLNTNIDLKIYKNEKNLKTVKNFEKAISLCSGDWIFLADQDDVWMPEKIEKMISFVKYNPKTLLLFSDGLLIDEKNERIEGSLWEKWGFRIPDEKLNSKETFKELLWNRNFVTGATAMISKKMMPFILPINIPKWYYHDCWISINAAGKNGLYCLRENLIHYRIHSSQQVGLNEMLVDENSIQEDRIQLEFINKMYNLFPDKKENILSKIIRKIKRV